MSLLSNQATNIPLHCNVCPKRPNFSDVSHLLTHIASKGHLSWYYKIKVKGSTDREAKKIIDDYDDWYDEYNVEELMSERLSQKEKKKGSGGNSSRRASGGSSRNTPAAARRPSNRLRDNMHLVDPALNRRLAADPLSRSNTPASFFSNGSSSNPLYGAYAAGLPAYSPSAYPFADSPLVKQESLDSDCSDEEDATFEPVTRRSTRRRHHQQSDSIASFIENDDYDALANDTAKLKGILWPGMDMFDSATPEMKRKRNQKKAISVLMSLQATSEVVEPTECVFDAGGVLRKEREITGNPESEDDLIEGESEPEPEVTEKKRPRRQRPRPALTEKNVNTGRVTRNRGQSHHPPFGKDTKKRGPYFDGADDDDDLTFNAPPPKKRTGLSIHRDNSGPDITFDNPAQLNLLTSSWRNPFQQQHVGQTNPLAQLHLVRDNVSVPRNHARDPSWSQPAPFRPTPNGGGLPAATFTNFGQYLNHHTTVPTSNSFNPNPLAGFSHSMGPSQGPLQQTNTTFSHHTGNNSWDMFGPMDHPDFGSLSAAEINTFNGNMMDMPAANPLFFSSNIKEDDEATISADESDREK